LLTNDYILNVHLSHEALGTYVSCVALKAGIQLPDTGTGGATQDAAPWPSAALGVAGLAAIVGGGALRTRRR
jgi:hypothetical protein